MTREGSQEAFPSVNRYAEHLMGIHDIEIVVDPERHNSGYEAGVAMLGAERWRVRTARVTPTKPGAFVAVWRRASDGSTQPYSAHDETVGLLVFVREDAHQGVFRFTAEHLSELGITRSKQHQGKRGFRVYPPWCFTLNPQATRSQAAQSAAFILL